MLNSIPDLYSLETSRPHASCDNQKMSSDIAKCSLGNQIASDWEPLVYIIVGGSHEVNQSTINAIPNIEKHSDGDRELLGGGGMIRIRWFVRNI